MCIKTISAALSIPCLFLMLECIFPNVENIRPIPALDASAK